MAQSSVVNPKFGELNSTEHSNEPESMEPENYDGIDLIKRNNENLTKPNVIKKLIGPYKGVAFRGDGDQRSVQKNPQSILSTLSFGLIGAIDLQKTRIRIPELHAHLPELGEDLNKVPATIAAMYPEFTAEKTDIPEAAPGTIVWCNFLDRENFKDPIYLGPVDDKKTGTSGGTTDSNTGVGLSGNAATGDSYSGTGYKNSAGQVAYPASPSNWSNQLPENGFTATNATVEDLINLVKQQIGKIEIPEGSNGGPQVDPFNGGRKEAWCAAGIAWCFRQIGAPLPGDKIPNPSKTGWNNVHSVNYIRETFQKLGSFFSEPKLGDMVVYNTSNNPNLVNSKTHIGLVYEIEGDIMKTAEFNWGNKVSVTKQDWKNGLVIKEDGQKIKNSYLIVGYARRPLPYQ